jgi:TonB family protein
MLQRISTAVITSLLFHVFIGVMAMTFLRPPEVRIRKDLPFVRILTLVRPPDVAAPRPAAPVAKPRIARPASLPAPINPVQAPEPVIEQPIDPPVPEPVVAEVAKVEALSGAVAHIPATQQPYDPVYPAGRLKDGLVPLVHTEVPYPLIAHDRGIEGAVDVQFVVDKSGTVEDIWIARSSHTFFSEAVMKKVRKWRFKPPKIDGKPVRVKASQHFDFKLE